jgi:hypothetical protein
MSSVQTNPRHRFTVIWALIALLGVHGTALAEDGDDARPVTLLATVPTPGAPLLAFDISWLEPATQTYYLADRSNAAIDVVDARHNRFLRQIHAGFRGFSGSNDTSGPNGVAVSGHWLFASDAGSRVVSIDLRSDTVADVAVTGGAPGLRADELAFDPDDGALLVVNNADSPPFATLIHVNQRTGQLAVGRRITFSNATNGAEQPIWDPGTRRFYLSIPEIGGNAPDGAVARINLDGTLERLFPVKACQTHPGSRSGPAARLQRDLRHRRSTLVAHRSAERCAGPRHHGRAHRRHRRKSGRRVRLRRGVVQPRRRTLLHRFARQSERSRPGGHRREAADAAAGRADVQHPGDGAQPAGLIAFARGEPPQ